MKYVALLSGGKDSCFNLICCSQNGHSLVAAASLGPGQGREEIDSFLYQTVGQDAIELVAEALDVPLYRGVISGTALDQGNEYGSREGSQSSYGVKGDETEDLFDLLSEVKCRHPEIQGVSVGAILSNYQRVRVEHVCQRLSLTPLCFLWQRNQEELLSEMIEARVEAVLIKVAGIGLKPIHLGKSLREMQPTLLHLNDLYGLHVCGEGGEYETLTLDCPLFRKRIVLKEVETVIHSDSSFATVAYTRVKTAYLEDKSCTDEVKLPTPLIVSQEFRELETLLSPISSENTQQHALSYREKRDGCYFQAPVNSFNNGKWVIVSNVNTRASTSTHIGEEVIRCFKLLEEKLHEHSLSLVDLVFVNILISDMTQFPQVNEAYKRFFGRSPPARACVAVDLPPHTNVKLDCIASFKDSLIDRRGLHVQGLSYWAPANIGPYSQAIIADDTIFISGQIGMIPSTLQLPSPPSFPREAALSFQHASRILKALQDMYGATWSTKIQGLICWLVSQTDVSVAQKFDKALSTYVSVPTIFVGAKTLPKGAKIETQVLAHTGRYVSVKDDESEICQVGHVEYEKGDSDLHLNTSFMHWESVTFKEIFPFFVILAFKGDLCNIQPQLIKEKISHSSIWSQTHSVRLFHKIQLEEQVYNSFRNLFEGATPGITTIPVKFIATRETIDWDVALCLIGS